MRLLLSRHGNTFNSGETPVWVGATEDLPLVASGKQQAEALGVALKEAHVQPVACYCSTLQRTSEYAAIALKKADISLTAQVHPALTEVNYGKWGGKSREEIERLNGGPELEAWEKDCAWPKSPGWTPSEKEFIERVSRFSQEITQKYKADDIVLAVSSNGVMRYFLKLVSGAFEEKIKDGSFKVKTGHLCGLSYDASTGWKIYFWNLSPVQALNQAK